jgi:serine/threonine-protein kinase/endoribonuclease IRE1
VGFYDKCLLFFFSSNSPTLYIGEHLHGLYALPSLADQNTVTIGPAQTSTLLLEGPSNLQSHQEPTLHYYGSSSSPGLPLPGHNVWLSQPSDHVNVPLTFQSLPKEENDFTAPVILLGE